MHAIPQDKARIIESQNRKLKLTGMKNTSLITVIQLQGLFVECIIVRVIVSKSNLMIQRVVKVVM